MIAALMPVSFHAALLTGAALGSSFLSAFFFQSEPLFHSSSE